MAYEFNGTNQYLSAAAPIDGVTKPFTLACWFNSDTVTANQYLVALSPANGNAWAITAHGTLAGDPVMALNTASATEAKSTSSYTANAWQHACGVFTSIASRTIYLNGGNSATNTLGEGNVSAATTLRIGTVLFFGGNTQYTDGRIAEVGIWNAALTSDEVKSLSVGMTCDKVRPSALVFYAPLIRNIQDLRQGVTLTNNNTATVAAHPRVYA